MKCEQCGIELKKKCPKCNSDLTKIENIICGEGIIPENHCYNCWSKE